MVVLSIQENEVVLIVRLKEMMEAYRQKTGERLTYQELADRVGVARTTIESIASRPDYNAGLRTIARICAALECAPGELLSLLPVAQNKKEQ